MIALKEGLIIDKRFLYSALGTINTKNGTRRRGNVFLYVLRRGASRDQTVVSEWTSYIKKKNRCNYNFI